MGSPPVSDRIRTYAAFWPYYLGEHRRPANRGCHYVGSLAAVAMILTGLAAGIWWLVPAAAVAGYGLAWFGHFAVERNRPATLRYPLWSLISDYRMLALWLAGRLGTVLRTL